MSDNTTTYDPPRATLPADLKPGDMIDLKPLFDMAEAPIPEVDRMSAESELAVVEAVENVNGERWSNDPTQRLITIYNGLCNIAVPERVQIDVLRHDADFDDE